MKYKLVEFQCLFLYLINSNVAYICDKRYSAVFTAYIEKFLPKLSKYD